MWEHYVACPVMTDWHDRVFSNKAERVVADLWVSFPRTTMLCTSLSKDIRELMIGFAESLCWVSIDACPSMTAALAQTYFKLVKDMHYEARVQTIITYNASFLESFTCMPLRKIVVLPVYH